MLITGTSAARRPKVGGGGVSKLSAAARRDRCRALPISMYWSQRIHVPLSVRFAIELHFNKSIDMT